MIDSSGRQKHDEKEGSMKNRERQRENRKIREEMPDLRDCCGVRDPTPREAVRRMMWKQHLVNISGRNRSMN